MLGELCLLLGDGRSGIREHSIYRGRIETGIALRTRRWRRTSKGVAISLYVQFRHRIAKTIRHGICCCVQLESATRFRQKRSLAEDKPHTFLAKVVGGEHARHRVILGHLLQYLDEEANLHLGRLAK